MARLGRREGREAAGALALATVSFTVCFVVWGSISPLAPYFARALSLSATETGILVALPVLLGALARVPAGLLADCHGGRRVFTGLLAFLLLPVTLVGTADSYPALLFWAFWLGLAGASFAIGVPFVTRWFPPGNQGLALGIYGIGNAGAALNGFMAPGIAAAFGWPAAFWAILPLLGLMAVLFWMLGRDAPGPMPPPASIASRLALFRTEPAAWVFSLFYSVTAGGFMAFAVYLPTYLVQAHGLELADAAMGGAAFILLGTISRPGGGFLADRFGGGQTLAVVFPAVALAAIVLAWSPQGALLPAAIVLMAVAVGAGNGAVFKLVADRFPRNAGVVSGVVGAAGGLFGFALPILLGMVRDLTGGYALGFLLLSAFALSNLALSLRMVRQRPAVRYS